MAHASLRSFHHQHDKRSAAHCQTYLSPAASDLVEAFAQTTLKWDPACLTTYDTVDIYLQSVDVGQPIHLWKSVTTADGQLSTAFIPSWWNSTKAATLQILITGSDQPAWAGSGPGPTFFAEFNGTAPASASAADTGTSQPHGLSVDIINVARSNGLSAGALASAVLFPLLGVGCLVAAFIFISRRRSGAASKRWSQYVDQRMSSATTAAKWEAGRLPTDPALSRPVSARVESMYRHSVSLPPKGSPAANRLSSAASLDQRSPTSMRQHRQSAASFNRHRQSTASFTQHRQSTISFADSPLPLNRSQKSSLSVHTSGIDNSDTPLELLVSPDQEQGPASLGRVGLGANRNSVASNSTSNSFKAGHVAHPSMARSTSNLRFEVGNAKGSSPHSILANRFSTATDPNASIDTPFNNDFWKSSPAAQDPSPASGMRRLSRSSTMSPDEALRQYTLARNRGPTSPVEALASTNSNGMRVLYTPHAPAASPRPAPAMKSVYTVASVYSTASATDSLTK